METSDYFMKKIEQLRSKVAEIKSNDAIQKAAKIVSPEKIRKIKNVKALEN